MPPQDDKRFLRQLKRDVKKAGNRRRRRFLDRALRDNPVDAANDEFDFGRDSSAVLNEPQDKKRTKKSRKPPQ